MNASSLTDFGVQDGDGVMLAERARGMAPYATTHPNELVDLHLASNECGRPAIDLEVLRSRLVTEMLWRYPDSRELERTLAERWGVDGDRVLVTAGGDDAIDRLCRSVVEAGREIIFPWPSFEMIERSANAAGGTVIRTRWRAGSYPAESVISQITPRTAMIAMVSPNNPTGLVATAEDLRRVARAAPRAVVMVDLAYAEFAGEEGEALMRAALALENSVAIRTFSKAFGLAGLRVGYAIGPAKVIRAMRSLGSPYPTSALGMAAAMELVRRGPDVIGETVQRVSEERSRLTALVLELGGMATVSRGNFVLCEFGDPRRVVAGLRALGIGVRLLQLGMDGGESAVRITCPGSSDGYERLERGLRCVLALDREDRRREHSA